MEPKIGSIYKHFKGNLYEVKAIAIHSETEEKMVVYQALYGDNLIYVRPLESFCSKVDKIKYPDSKQEYRFEEQKPMQEPDIDPMVLSFLESEDFEEKFDILSSMAHKITKDQIQIMAMSLDVAIDDSDVQDMYRQLKTCVDTRRRFETTRLR
ncbi:MAG: DUF1653 domain-containing protein [Lachnospiraceae bacterium]|nr:DUF1653 domain-containing protein [Lachnospiraceae bacterium]